MSYFLFSRLTDIAHKKTIFEINQFLTTQKTQNNVRLPFNEEV